ncbi:MAG TPA: hypothetical protein VGL93_16580 [Streptosporangiaceae bacterium]
MISEQGNGGVARRALLAGGLGLAGAVAAGGPAGAAARARGGRRVLVATNEPWGTYHVQPLLAEAARRRWRLTQLVPDLSQIAAGDPVPVATLDDLLAGPHGRRHPDAYDLLVVAGADDWPLECAARLRHLPMAASSLAYLGPDEAPGARRLRGRLRVITSSSAAESRAFAGYLGTRRRIRVVGSPQTDGLPARAPEDGLALVLTSVTHPDATGAAAPGTELLLASAARLADAGWHILVGLHPREDRTLWERYEIADVPSVTASARAQVAIGIPGTVFPLVAAVGTPVVGCVDPALNVPKYLLDVCSSTISDAAEATTAATGAYLPSADVLADAVGPIGGSAARLLSAWSRVARG